jgi:hypothetical protein
VSGALAPVAPGPLAEDQSAADRDLSTFGEMAGAGLGLLAEGGDVDEGRLPLLTAASGIVDGEPQLADRAGAGVAQLGVAGETTDHVHVVHLLPPSPSGSRPTTPAELRSASRRTDVSKHKRRSSLSLDDGAGARPFRPASSKGGDPRALGRPVLGARVSANASRAILFYSTSTSSITTAGPSGPAQTRKASE